MTKKEMKNSLRASIESSSTTISVNEMNADNTPNNKRKYIKNEVEEFKKKLEEHKDNLHESMTKFLNSLYDELENSRVNLESSCLKSLQKYGDCVKKLESIRNQNMESSLKLQKMQNMIQTFSNKITQV